MKKLAAQALILAMLLPAGACVTKKDESRAIARTGLGTAYLTEQNDEMAIKTLREATELDKHNAEAWHMLAMAYMRKGAYEESEKAFKKALRISGTSAQIQNNYSYLLLHLDRPADAVVQLEDARGDLLYRKPALTLNNLGYAYILLEQCDQAAGVLQEAVSRAPNYCQAWFNLGLASRCVERPDAAIDALDRVILTCPEQTAGAWLQISEIQEARGRLPEAIDACRELLAVPALPGEIAENARRRLAEMEAQGGL